jgi:hypothetical protein
MNIWQSRTHWSNGKSSRRIARSGLNCTKTTNGRPSILHFALRRDPRSKAGPRLIAKQLRGWQGSRCWVLAKLVIEEGVVKSRTSCVSGTAAIVNRIEPCPVAGRQAHRARLATGVKFAAGKAERAQRLARRADGIDFAVGGRIVRRCHRVDAFTHDASISHNDGGKRAASGDVDVPDRQHDGTAQKLGMRWSGDRQLAHNLLMGRK